MVTKKIFKKEQLLLSHPIFPLILNSLSTPPLPPPSPHTPILRLAGFQLTGQSPRGLKQIQGEGVYCGYMFFFPKLLEVL